MGASQVINLLKIANNQLPSVQHRHDVLQKQNNFESILRAKAGEINDLKGQMRDINKRLDAVKSESRREAAVLEGLRQQSARLETFVYNYKNNNEKYIELIKSIENKLQDLLSEKKAFLKLAIFSLIQSMRSNPEKYSALVYHNNDNQNSISSTSKYNSNSLDIKGSSRQVILPPPPYDEYIIEGYKAIVLEDAEKLYNILTDQLLCEVVNEGVTRQSPVPTPSLPELSLEQDNSI
jgi:peptidoglycan hydrolase CwlO-like protein